MPDRKPSLAGRVVNGRHRLASRNIAELFDRLYDTLTEGQALSAGLVQELNDTHKKLQPQIEADAQRLRGELAAWRETERARGSADTRSTRQQSVQKH